MVNYILFLNQSAVTGGRYERSRYRHKGAALITAVMVLLSLALLGLSLSGQQVLARYQQINLDERRLLRQLASEQLFDDIAQNLEMSGRLDIPQAQGYVAHPFHEGGVGQRLLYSQITGADCPHDFDTLSQCWRVQVRQAGTGFIRERMLVAPKTSCAPAYWFPPQGRMLTAPPMPPTDEPPDPEVRPDPVRPPADPKPGGGLRP